MDFDQTQAYDCTEHLDIANKEKDDAFKEPLPCCSKLIEKTASLKNKIQNEEIELEWKNKKIKNDDQLEENNIDMNDPSEVVEKSLRM